MRRNSFRVEISAVDETALEIRFWDNLNDPRYLCWRMHSKAGDDLAQWWMATSSHVKPCDLPIANCKSGGEIVSMAVESTIEVRILNRYGGLELLGYPLPGEVVEYLAGWLDQSGSHVHHS